MNITVITANIYYGNSVESLSDLIVKPETTYHFAKPLSVKIHGQELK